MIGSSSEEQKGPSHQLVQILPIGVEPDMYMVHGENIYPFRKELLAKCALFSQSEFRNKQLHLLSEELNVLKFVSEVSAVVEVLHYLYSSKWRFKRDISLLSVLEVAKYFGCSLISQELSLDISHHFCDYGIFLLLRIAEKLSMEELEEKCWREILIYNFEFININKTDLLEYDKISFTSILRKHHNLKKAKVIKGIRNSDIATVVSEYHSLHGITISEEDIMKTEEEDLQFISKMETIISKINASVEEEDQTTPRKRNKTWDSPGSKPHAEYCASPMMKELEDITEMNNQMKTKSLNLIEEIFQVRSQLSMEPLKKDGLVKRFCEFQSKFEEFEEKYEEICKEISIENEAENGRSSKTSENTHASSSEEQEISPTY